jgi:methionyl-tRNA formyltransferase
VKLAIFCTKFIGRGVLNYLISSHPNDIRAVIYLDQDREILKDCDLPSHVKAFEYNELKDSNSSYYDLTLDLVIISWFPKIIPSTYYAFSRLGAINTHNSLLPIGRGVHANYWAIKNKEPYGVSIHKVTDETDAGDLVLQRKIDYSWEDTGETLYQRGLDYLLDMFKENYNDLESFITNAAPQDLSAGSLYFLKDMAGSFEIDLQQTYRAKDLLNLIRAKQFDEGECAYFLDGSNRYQVKVHIKKINED